MLSTSRAFISAFAARTGANGTILCNGQVHNSFAPLLASFRFLEKNGVPLLACGAKKAASQMRAGDILDKDGVKYQITKFMWNHGAARASGFITLEMVDLVSGNKTSEKCKVEDMFQLVDLEKKTLQVLFTEGDKVTLLDNESFEQVEMDQSLFGEGSKWLVAPDLEVEVKFHEGQPVYGVLPQKVSVKVVAAPRKDEPEGTRHVTVEGGFLVAAPSFIKVGDTIVVRTADCTYAGK